MNCSYSDFFIAGFQFFLQHRHTGSFAHATKKLRIGSKIQFLSCYLFFMKNTVFLEMTALIRLHP